MYALVDRPVINQSRHSSTGNGQRDRRNKNKSVISTNSYGVVERNQDIS